MCLLRRSLGKKGCGVKQTIYSWVTLPATNLLNPPSKVLS